MDRRFVGVGRFSVCAIIVLGILLVIVDETGARRGGLGRGGFGRSRSSSRSSSRSRWGSRSRNKPVYTNVYASRRPWGYGTPYRSWRSYGSSGYIYGYVYYTRTRHYRDYPDREPTICSNDYDYRYNNGTAYHLFICPTQNQTADYNYCCGPVTRQTCCRGGRRGVNMYGIIAGLLAFVIVAITMIYCCCFRRAQPTSQPFFQARIMSQRHNLRPRNTHYSAANSGPVTVMNPPIQHMQPASYQQNATPMYPLKPDQVPVIPDNYADGHGNMGGYPPAAGYQPTAPPQAPAGYGIAPPDAAPPTSSPPPPYPACPYPAQPYPPSPYPPNPASTAPYPPPTSPAPPYPYQ